MNLLFFQDVTNSLNHEMANAGIWQTMDPPRKPIFNLKGDMT